MISLYELFDPEYYLDRNPDIARAGIDASWHFYNYGLYEKREFSRFFSVDEYVMKNHDVAAAGVNPAIHYESHGQFENRTCNNFFDESSYLSQYSDVASLVESGIFTSGFEHYVKYGFNEGRTPGQPAKSNIPFNIDNSFPTQQHSVIQNFHDDFMVEAENLWGITVSTEPFTMYYTPTTHPGWNHDRSEWFSPISPDHRYSITNGDYYSNPDEYYIDYYWFYTNEIIQKFLDNLSSSFQEHPDYNVSMVFRVGENIPQASATILCSHSHLPEYDYVRQDYQTYYNSGIRSDFLEAIHSLNPSTIYQLDTNYQFNGFTIEVSQSLYLSLYENNPDFFKNLFSTWSQKFDGTEDAYAQMIIDAYEYDTIFGTSTSEWVLNHPMFKRDEDTSEYSLDVVTVEPITGEHLVPRDYLGGSNPNAFFITGHSDKYYEQNKGIEAWEIVPDYAFFNQNASYAITNSAGQVVASGEAHIVDDLDNEYSGYIPNLPSGQYTISAYFVTETGVQLSDGFDFTLY